MCWFQFEQVGQIIFDGGWVMDKIDKMGIMVVDEVLGQVEGGDVEYCCVGDYMDQVEGFVVFGQLGDDEVIDYQLMVEVYWLVLDQNFFYGLFFQFRNYDVVFVVVIIGCILMVGFVIGC